MKRFALVIVLGAMMALVPSTAQAHHSGGVTASKITSGVFYICRTNGAESVHGTTRVHLHRKKPSRRHMRRHRCHRVTLKLPGATPGTPAAPGTVINLPDGTQLVVGPGGAVTINININQNQSQTQSQTGGGVGGDDDDQGGPPEGGDSRPPCKQKHRGGGKHGGKHHGKHGDDD